MADDTEPDPPSERGPRVEPAHRRRDPAPETAPAEGTTPAPPPGTAARTEPVVDIAPPRWFAVVARAGAAAVALLGVVTAGANLANGNLAPGLLCLAGGVGLAAMAADAATRSARSDGDVLALRQWFRTVTLHRADVEGFEAQRASFVRWDIVAVPTDGVQVRLWVTRMLPAGRAERQAWLTQLEAWRTWIGPSSS